MQKIYETRLTKISELLKKNKIPALLVTHAANRFYLSGFELRDSQCNESSGCLLICANGAAWLFTDPRYEIEACKHWNQNKIIIYSSPTSSGQSQIIDFIEKQGIKQLAIEPTALLACFYALLQKKFELIEDLNIVENLRLIKDEYEIDLMRKACELNHKVYEQIQPKLIPGLSEKEIAWELEMLFRNQGAQGLSFSTIVGIDHNAALPHANPSDKRLTEDSMVLIDMGCRLNDYCSDQTRVFWIGNNPSQNYLTTLQHVKNAQQAALDILRPGICCCDAYFASFKYFEKYGLASYFTHGLGHGIGLETHEAPSLNPKNKIILQPGMIVTVEPGLYYPDWGGVRWEYMVLITEGGCEIF